jgi:pseudooxynicotine oxidase
MSDRDYDVIVIGGGFAGVTAGRELSLRGRRTLLLEARTRLGGRTHVAEFAGHRVELGGAWVRWNQPYVWAEIARYGLALAAVPEPGGQGTLLRRGELSSVTGEDGVALMVALRRFCEPALRYQHFPYATATTELPEELEQLSVRQRLIALALPPRVHDLLDAVLSITCHAPLEEAATSEVMRIFSLSGHDPAQMLATLGQLTIAEGTAALIDAIAADSSAEVRLNAPVTCIRRIGGDRVDVSVAGAETLSARAVVVTVPLNVLSSIEFTPELIPEKRDAIAEGHVGRGVKLYAQVRGDLGNVSLFAPGELSIGWGASISHDPRSSLLVLFGSRPDALSFHDATEVNRALQRYLPEAEVEQVFGWDWNADPYARGTWCMLRPGRARTVIPAMQAPEGRVHFASGDTADGWRGFIDGAIERGLCVSQQVHRQLAGSSS